MQAQEIKLNHLYNTDCIQFIEQFCSALSNIVNHIFTDIPYGGVNNHSNGGLRKLYKAQADQITFDLNHFLNLCTQVCSGNTVIFCGQSQLSQIYSHFKALPGTTRILVWEKTNPSPMNGKQVYLSGIELAVYYKSKECKTFNGFCKNTVFKHPSGSSELHPTEKNLSLIEEILSDISNKGDVIFDPCAGSGSTLLVSSYLNRKYIGCELYKPYYDKAVKRLKSQSSMFNSYNP